MAFDILTQHDNGKGQELQKESLNYTEKAKALAQIKDDAGLGLAADFLKTIKNFRVMVEEHYREDIKKAHGLWKSLTEKRKQADDPLDAAERIVKQGIAAYYTEQERVRRIEEEKRQAEARRQAEEAQLAAAQEAEQNGEHARAAAIIDMPVPVVAAAPR